METSTQPPKPPRRAAHVDNLPAPVGAKSVSRTPVRTQSSRHPTTASARQTAQPTPSEERARPSATRSRSFASGVANPAPSKQPEIEKQIDMEMEDAVFLDKNFVENFLSGDPE